MKLLPRARIADIVVQDLKTEVLIYDLRTNRAYCLNETAASVFNHCDGKTMFDDLKRSFKFTDDLIYFALDELAANCLLDDYRSEHFNGLSRREAIKRVGLASMVALPVIAALTAPPASHAQSRLANNRICTRYDPTGSSECASGRCSISLNADGKANSYRCCANQLGGNAADGYVFFGTDQTNCSNLASDAGVCCSGEATYSNRIGNGGCTCSTGTPPSPGTRLANNQICTTFAQGNSTECASGNCTISVDANGTTNSYRCCANNFPGNGTTDYSFPGTDQANCSYLASSGACCSGAATYSNNIGNGGCTCT